MKKNWKFLFESTKLVLLYYFSFLCFVDLFPSCLDITRKQPTTYFTQILGQEWYMNSIFSFSIFLELFLERYKLFLLTSALSFLIKILCLWSSEIWRISLLQLMLTYFIPGVASTLNAWHSLISSFIWDYVTTKLGGALSIAKRLCFS